MSDTTPFILPRSNSMRGSVFPLRPFSSSSFITPKFLHPTFIPIAFEYNILNMFFHLDFSLLEVIFIYTIKKSKNDIFSMFAHISSLRLVTGLPHLNKVRAKGHVLVRGPWASLMEHPEMDFHPNYSLKIPGRDDSERPFPINIW